ncbi:MAG: T9SS type A sorting domain-containing protein [Bacteroidetes bacterium]|nr:T9SS type A sorting domain-containing protein [Bacteroidota bacterium]
MILDSLVLPIDVRSYNGLGSLGESVMANYDSSYAMLDLTGQRLLDGRVLLAWSAVGSDDSADVYIALFGSDWSLLSPPKRLNSVTTRDQYGVRLFVHGDSVSVAWLDNRDREWHVYYRCFAIDRVLNTSSPRLRQSFEIEGPWPHPASGITTFSIRGIEQNISMRIVDALGSIVWTGNTAGSSTFSVDLHSFSPGIYFLHASTELGQSVRLFIVR